MPSLAIRSMVATLVLAGSLTCGSAIAQEQPQEPAPPKPYKKVAVSLPTLINDPSFEAFRKQLADIAQRKDRTALGPLVVSDGFFWEREGGDGADKKKSGIDNLATAIGLDAPDDSGWDFLADYAAEPTASSVGDRQHMICAPAYPVFDENEFMDVVQATETNPIEWGYPTRDGIEARETAKPDSKLVEKLGMHLIRVVFDDVAPDPSDPMLRIVTPSGNLAFIPAEVLSPLGIDQLCYIKQDSTWKIVGYVGEGAPQ